MKRQIVSEALVLVSLTCTCGLVASGQSTSSASTVPTKPQTRVRTTTGGFDLSKQTGKSPNQIGGASRDLGEPTLYAPGLGKSYALHPTFHWSSGGAGDKVRFALMSSTGNVQYETETVANQLTYPDDAPALVPGQVYQWTITPENDLLGGEPGSASVLIVSGEERDRIAQDLTAVPAGSPAADVFIKYRLWYDAVQAYADQLKRTPGNHAALASRAVLYDELPVTRPLAQADRAGVR